MRYENLKYYNLRNFENNMKIMQTLFVSSFFFRNNCKFVRYAHKREKNANF